MKLSEAMMLGEIMLPRNNGSQWFGDNCGCAIGRAWLAVGRTDKEWQEEWLTKGTLFAAEWPRLNEKELHYTGYISSLFLKVLDSKITFEQLVDYVRSIEPNCGECNYFECACAKTVESAEIHAHISTAQKG